MARGKIRNLEAYIQGKLLDHSGWDGFLPSKITPSDIDFCIEYRGHVVMAELKGATGDWREVSFGQRKLYETLVRIGKGKIVAACAKHASPPYPEEVNTFAGLVEYSFMYWDRRKGNVFTSDVFPAESFPQFVKHYLRY